MSWHCSPRLRASLGLVLLWTVAFPNLPVANGFSIGVNFNRNADEVFDQSTAAGAVSHANWNQTTPDNSAGPIGGTLSGLLDANGSTTTASVTWQAANTWAQGGANQADGNISLLKGYLDDGGTGAQVDVSGIPYAEYDLYLYGIGDGAQGIPMADFTVTAGAFSATPSWLRAANLAPGDALKRGSEGVEGHYYLLEGLTASSLTITALNNAGAGRAPLAGFQIVDANAVIFDATLKVTINRDNGNVTLLNNTGATVQIAGTGLLSAAGVFEASNWLSIANNYDSGGGVSADPWIILSQTANDLSEATLGTGALTQGQSINLGNGLWRQFYGETQDIRFEFLDAATGETKNGIVEFTGTQQTVAFQRGDLNFDGSINALDWPIQRDGFNADLSGATAYESYLSGDLNADGLSDSTDLGIFKNLFEAANGAGSFAAMLAVPEPTSCALLAIAGIACTRRRVRKAAGLCAAVACVVALTLGVDGAHAASIGVNLTESDDGGATPRPDQTIPADGLAGLLGVRQTNWNNVPEGNPAANLASPFALRDSAGATTNASVSWSIDLAWGAGVADLSRPDDRMARGYWDDGQTSEGIGIDLQVANVPYSNYSVILYLTSDQGDGGQFGNYTVNGSTQAGGETRAFNTGPNAYGGWVPGENTLLFEGLTGSTLDIEAQPRNGSTRASLAGFQIIQGSTVDYQLTLEVNKDTGRVRILNDLNDALDIDFFQITSAAGALSPATWSPLGSGTNDGSNWEALGNLDDSILAQFYLQGESTLANGNALSLGAAYDKSVFGAADGDLEFRYRASGLDFVGKVEYVTGGGIPGDFNGDGSVNGADLLVWQRGFGSTYNSGDFATWEDNFGTSGAAAAVSAVPEPSSALLAMAACGLVLSIAKRRTQGGRSMAGSLETATRVRRVTPMVALAAAAVAASASVASAAFTLDRNYKLGEGAGENGSAGAVVGSANSLSPGSTLDEVGPSGAFLDLQVSGGPTYVNVASGTFARPGATGLAANFDGVDDLLRGIPLNRPDELSTLVEGYPLNYTGIVRRGMQGYIYPSQAGLNAGTFQSIVVDTVLSGGPAINAAGQWTQVNSQHSSGADGIAPVPATVSVPAGNTWYHFMHHNYLNSEGYGARVVAGTGGTAEFNSVLYIDGIAVSANNDAIPTGGVGSYLGSLVVGAREVPNDGLTAAYGDYFQGAVDNLEMYVVGDNTAQGGQNWGEFNLLTDNAWIAARIASTVPGGVLNPGDVNRDGAVNGTGTGPVATDDISAFIAGWRKEKRFQAAHNQVTAGDWETWGWGDMNLDGVVNFSDWQILRETHPNGAGLNLAALLSGTAVPEPTSGLLLAAGLALAARGRSRRGR